MAAAGRALSYEHGLGCCEGLGYLAGDATTVPSAATTKAWQQRETTNRGWWGLWHPFGTLCHPLQPAASAAHSLPEVPIPLPQARLCLSVRVFSASWSPHLTTPSILRDPSALHCTAPALRLSEHPSIRTSAAHQQQAQASPDLPAGASQSLLRYLPPN
ncbi:unnamed protein product [Clonostachys rhizophaga]|uniref:Uncharacterized protein n=1 Tax=Clonostachys rhizophaga TaxID=160324 RepID=A0A9N9YAB6_9HYPO|nr:unnamed protein product [Clonostachys rhizophaga]